MTHHFVRRGVRPTRHTSVSGGAAAALALLASVALLGAAAGRASAAPPVTVPPGSAVESDPPADDAVTLRSRFSSAGRLIGVAIDARKLDDPAYASIVNREFGAVTPETAMEWDAVEPRQGQFNFRTADGIVAHARANQMQVHGRALVAPSAFHTAWLASLTAASTLRPAMKDHITAVMTHFRGQVRSWGVVSEAYTDTGTRRPNGFQTHLGAGYIEEAFHAARAADPEAKLCYSEYNIEDFTRPKTRAVYEMVRDFKARGVPIDCVALQSHFTYGNAVPAGFQDTLTRFAALGVDVHLSELDVGASGGNQAEDYRRVITACLSVPRCTDVTIWGVRDPDSWRSNDTPLLFDAAGAPKPAYYAVLGAWVGRRSGAAPASFAG